MLPETSLARPNRKPSAPVLTSLSNHCQTLVRHLVKCRAHDISRTVGKQYRVQSAAITKTTLVLPEKLHAATAAGLKSWSDPAWLSGAFVPFTIVRGCSIRWTHST